MARGRCESRLRRRPFAGKTERRLEGALLFPLPVPAQTEARAASLELDRLLAGGPFELPTGFADAVERYVALLLEANRRLNLTRVVEPADVARLHLLDALSALPLIDALPDARRAVDLGSGGGVPGLVVALARPDQRWLLVDSVRKKADAVREFAAALGIR